MVQKIWQISRLFACRGYLEIRMFGFCRTNVPVAAKFARQQQKHKHYNRIVATRKKTKKTVATKFAHPMAREPALKKQWPGLGDTMRNQML